MGKRNKVVKITKKKIGYIIRAKNKNDNNKNIAVDMKISKSTGRKKTVTDEESEKLMLEVQKEQKLY